MFADSAGDLEAVQAATGLVLQKGFVVAVVEIVADGAAEQVIANVLYREDWIPDRIDRPSRSHHSEAGMNQTWLCLVHPSDSCLDWDLDRLDMVLSVMGRPQK